MRFRNSLASIPLALCVVCGSAQAAPRAPFLLPKAFAQPPPERGVGLGLFSADSSYRYRMLVDEVAQAGATHISVVWVWWQDNLRSTTIANKAGWSATDEQVVDTLKYAKSKGLHVTAFPIVRLQNSGPSEWRGKIAPDDEDAWWSSYNAFILHCAELAASGGADRFSVGSELLSRERMRSRWREIIDRVRLGHPQLELLYSSNWDHFEPVSFWDLVDVVGLTAYWELTRDLNPSVSELVMSWRNIRPQIEAFSKRLGRKVVFTEVGYPSLDGGAAWPWDETRKAPVDLDEQRRAYEAFVRAWGGAEALQGVYWWNWFGFGGAEDTNYTPRGKPAADVIQRWYQSKGKKG